MSSASRFASDAPSESQEQAPAGRSKQAQPFSEALLKAPPHPTLVEPKLYVYGLKDSDISDQEVMKTLIHCLRAR